MLFPRFTTLQPARYFSIFNNFTKNNFNLVYLKENYRYYSDDSILSLLDKRSKKWQIQSSVMFYLKSVRDHENFISLQNKEFEKGKKYLAQIMGQDPDTITQDEIDAAIEYLLPSGLFSERSRPKFKPPEEIFPARKQLQCDLHGRPLHDMFYTRFPNYYREAVYHLEYLKLKEDQFFLNKEESNSINEMEKMSLIATEWLKKEDLKKLFNESITDIQYDQWILLMNKLLEHPLSSMVKIFIFNYRTNPISYKDDQELTEPMVEVGTNRKYMLAYGQKKNSFAEATVYMPGFGNISINDKNLLEVFPELGNREQIMFPLQLTKTLGKVDISANVSGCGNSSMANALRLAISRALVSLLPDEIGRKKLRVSGLLTQDHRFNERKQSGQKKARKKPIWKAR